jgi:hypothetical protein
VANRADLALANNAIDEILAVLYTGREARERMIGLLKGRDYTLHGNVRDARPTPATRVSSPVYQGGLTVLVAHPSTPRPLAVRFPADRTEWLGELSIGAELEVDAVFVEWDELADCAVFEEKGS